jgi:hypothetical protein
VLSELYKETECFQALPPGYVEVLDDRPDVELSANAACAGWSAAMVSLQVDVASRTGLSAETDLVTITAGGIDVGFSGILEACLKPSPLDACKRAVKAGEATARTAALSALQCLRGHTRQGPQRHHRRAGISIPVLPGIRRPNLHHPRSRQGLQQGHGHLEQGH